MKSYVFVPVPTIELNARALDLVNTCKPTAPNIRVLKNFWNEGRLKGVSRALGGCLKHVGSADVVYLLAHGAGESNSTHIGNRRHVQKGGDWTIDGTLKSYDMTQLASVLEKEGLRKNFRDLHMLTCGSGLQGSMNDPTDTPLAKRLQQAMYALGYADIVVTGYQGDVNVTGFSGWFKVNRQKEPPIGMLPANDFKVSFGPGLVV